MPFLPNWSIPRKDENYEKTSYESVLSFNLPSFIANNIGLRTFKKTISEIMNPYLVTNLTGTTPTNVQSNAIVLGQNNVGGAATLILGSNNTQAIDSGVSNIIGDFNTVGANSTSSTVIGLYNNVIERSAQSIVLGFQNILGSTDTSNISFDQTINIGNNLENYGYRNTIIGNYSNASIGSSEIILIGTNGLIEQYCSNCVAIGTNTLVEDSDTVVIGSYAKTSSVNSVALGSNAYTAVNSNGSVAIGASASAEEFRAIAVGSTAHAIASNSAQIGSGTNSTADTLQFGNTKIANNSLGICVKNNNSAPNVSTDDVGTLGLNTGTFQYVDNQGNWVNLGGNAVKYGALCLTSSNNQTIPVSSFNNLQLNNQQYLTPSTFNQLPVTYSTLNDTFAFSQTGLYKISLDLNLTSTGGNDMFSVYPMLNVGNAIFDESYHFRSHITANTVLPYHCEFIVDVQVPNSEILLILDNTGNSSKTILKHIQSPTESSTYKITLTAL